MFPHKCFQCIESKRLMISTAKRNKFQVQHFKLFSALCTSVSSYSSTLKILMTAITPPMVFQYISDNKIKGREGSNRDWPGSSPDLRDAWVWQNKIAKKKEKKILFFTKKNYFFYKKKLLFFYKKKLLFFTKKSYFFLQKKVPLAI